MAKPLKIVVWILASLLLLLVAAVIALPLLFDPNDYRTDLAAAIKKETGRSFSVGHIKLAVLPWLRVSVKDVLLGNAEGFSALPMLRVKEADVGVKLWPLLTGQQLRADTITLNGLRATLEVNSEGRSNWADLVERQQKKDAAATKDGQGASLRGLDLAGLAISDAAISYSDAQTQKQYTVDGLRLKTGRIHGANPFNFDAAASITSSAPSLAANTEASGTMRYDASTGSVSIGTLKSRVKAALRPAAPGQPLAFDAAFDTALLNYDGATRVLSTAPLTLTLASLLRGKAEQPSLTAKGPIAATLSFDLAQRRYAAKGFTAALELGGSSVPGGKPQAITLAGDLGADLAADSASLLGLSLSAFGLNASSTLTVAGLASPLPTLSGPLTLAPFEPRKLLAALGIAAPKTADAQALASAQFATQFTASSKVLRLDALTLKLDQTKLGGDLAVTSFEPVRYAFKLKADALDADRYLPPRVVPPAGEAPVKKVDVKSAELPVELLQKLDAEGTLDVGRLTLKGVVLTDAVLRLSGEPRAVKRQQLSANLYGGRAELALTVSQAARPNLSLNTALTSISAGPLLKDLLGKDYLTGDGNVNFALTTSGRNVADLKRGLNGTVNFALANGVVLGFNLGKIVRDGQALRSGAAASGNGAASTDFAELTGSGVFVNGVLKSENLNAKNPFIRLEGAGELDLAGETINYLAKPTLVNTSSGQGGKELAAVRGVVIPVRLSGNLYKPKVSIDWQTALQQQALDKVRANLKGKEEEFKAKAAEEIGKGLMRLFGGKKTAPPDAPVSSNSPAQ